MTAPLDLKALREAAERATQGEWKICTAPDTNNLQAVCDHYFEFIARTDIYSIHPDEACEANARHIAAFHPAACLALLDRCERAEAERDGLQTAQNLTATIDRLKSDRDAAIARAEQAEAERDEQFAWWEEERVSLLARADLLQAERDEAERQLAECRAEYLQLRNEHAGTVGENMGLAVSDGFFQRRCELLEAATVRKLTPSETDCFKGCCPLCALSPADYITETERMAAARTELAICSWLRAMNDIEATRAAETIESGDWRAYKPRAERKEGDS